MSATAAPIRRTARPDRLSAADRDAVRAALPELAAALARKVAGGADLAKTGPVLDALLALAAAVGAARELVTDAYELAVREERAASAPASPPARPAAVPNAPRALGRTVDVLFSADGALVERGRYELLSYNHVVASHNPDCTANAAHRLPGAQPRDRSATELCRQADRIAAALNPAVVASLGTSAFDGPPVVNGDGLVIQGNGRSISLRVAYERYGKRARAYRDYLIEHAEGFGLTADDVRSFRTPVLVRTIEVDDARAVKLGNALNNAEAPQAPLDRAKALARGLDASKRRALGRAVQALLDSTDADTLRGALDQPDAVHLVDRLPGIERTGLVKDGALSTGGKDLLRDVLVALLMDDGSPGVNARFEALPSVSRGGIERSLGHLVALVGTPHDLGPRLRASAEIVRRVRGSGGKLAKASDVLNQRDAFEAAPGLGTATFTDDDAALAELLLTAKTQRDVSVRLTVYARLSTGYDNLFESVPPAAPADAFRRAVVEGERPNPGGLALSILGLCVELDVAAPGGGRGPRYTDPDGGTLLVWLPELSRLLLVPAERAFDATAAAPQDGARDVALGAFAEWLHDEPDGRALALDLPAEAVAPRLPRSMRVGTGRSVRYLSDKRMEDGDRAGRLNGYHHDFDAGQRAVHEIPHPTGGPPVLSVSALAIDGRGILN